MSNSDSNSDSLSIITILHLANVETANSDRLRTRHRRLLTRTARELGERATMLLDRQPHCTLIVSPGREKEKKRKRREEKRERDRKHSSRARAG